MLRVSIVALICLAGIAPATAQTANPIPSAPYPKGAGAAGPLPADFDPAAYGPQQARDDFYCAGVLGEWFAQTKLRPDNVMEVVSLTTPLGAAGTDALAHLGANGNMISTTSTFHSKKGKADYRGNRMRISVDDCKKRQQQLPQYPPKSP